MSSVTTSSSSASEPGRPRRRLVALRCAAAAAAAVTACATGPTAYAAAGATTTDRGWVGSWSTGTVPPDAGGLSARGFSGQTLREIVHTGVGGDEVRIRISNAFGAAPLTVDDMAVGERSSGAAVVPGTNRHVTFGGRTRVVLPAGAERFSDPVPLWVAGRRDLAVSLYVRGATGPATWHPTALTTSYYSGAGDHTGDAAGGAFGSTTTSWYLLDGVDVRRTGRRAAVVAFGDSITDGTNSTPGAGRSWPRDLSRRLAATRAGRGTAVLNEGISGNRVLTDAGTAGVSALARFHRDALAQTGVRDVIFLEGINDIGRNAGPGGGTLTARQLIDGIKTIIRAAHAHGLRIIGGTLTPIGGSGYDSPQAEAKRQAVNAWIRGGHAFDAVVDFDRAVRDPAHPTRFLPALDSGDHLHPDDAGYQAMADAIDLRLLDH